MTTWKGGGPIATIHGLIEQATAHVRARVMPDGRLELGRGYARVCVDTGFTGDLAVPRRILRRLHLVRAGLTTYRLADGSAMRMQEWIGRVMVGGREYEAVLMEGEALLGMEFMRRVGRSLFLNMLTDRVRLSLRR